MNSERVSDTQKAETPAKASINHDAPRTTSSNSETVSIEEPTCSTNQWEFALGLKATLI